jgi:hypothetical protein
LKDIAGSSHNPASSGDKADDFFPSVEELLGTALITDGLTAKPSKPGVPIRILTSQFSKPSACLSIKQSQCGVIITVIAEVLVAVTLFVKSHVVVTVSISLSVVVAVTLFVKSEVVVAVTLFVKSDVVVAVTVSVSLSIVVAVTLFVKSEVVVAMTVFVSLSVVSRKYARVREMFPR